MNWTLYKVFFKKNLTLWAIFVGVCCLYLLIMTFTKEMLDEVMAEMMGGQGTDILTYLATTYFDSIITMFPMVFYVMVAHKLVAKAVDNTSMSTYLTSGISRRTYTATAAVYLLSSIFLLFAILFGLGAACMYSIESINLVNYANVVLSSMLCTMLLAMVSFFMSNYFAGTKMGLGLAIAVPVAFLIVFMIGETVAGISGLQWVQYLSPFGWTDMGKIAAGTYNLWWLAQLGYLIGIGVLFYLSVFFFKRKQLSI